MNPWSTDGDLAKFEDLENLNKYIIFNSGIREYLGNTGENDTKFFIVAPKGYGKTLLLKAKSSQYRKKSGYLFIPSSALLEKMAKSTISFGVKELNQYKTLEIWEDIWLLSLSILILRNIEDFEMPPVVAEMIGRAKALSDILYNVLYERKKIFTYKRLIHRELLPAVREIRSQIAVFIDNIDEAFDSHIGENYKRKKSRI